MKKSRWLVLATFLMGILLANLIDQEMISNYGIWNEYFISQYSFRQIDADRLFCHVFLVRMKALVLMLLCAQLVRGRAFFTGVACVFAGAFGFLLTAAITSLGFRGIVLVIGGLFPQWLLYIAAFFVFAFCMQERSGLMRHGTGAGKERSAKVMLLILSALILLAGIVSESYLNPFFLGEIIKII